MIDFPRVSLIFSAFFFSLTANHGQAQETMLGSHGGAEQSDTPGAISVVDQDNASLVIINVPTPGIGITGLATDSEGRIFASTGTASESEDGPRLLEIDPDTGEIIDDIGRLKTAADNDCFIGDLSFQPGTDVLFGIAGNNGPSPRCDDVENNRPGGTLVTIDTETAEVTVVGRDPELGNANGGIAFAANGTLYFTPCWQSGNVLLTINPANADILTTTELDDLACFQGLAVRPSDGTIFGSFNQEAEPDAFSVVTINPANGAVTVLGDTAPEMIHDLTFTEGLPDPVVNINPGMNDAWLKDGTEGQGFFIVVLPDAGIVFLAWFTYDTVRPPMDVMAMLGEPGHRWVTAQGPYEGDTAVLDVYLTEGGVFDSEEPEAQTGEEPIGTIEIIWHDCNNATLSYEIDPPGVAGEMEIHRVVPDNVAVCQALNFP